jgi:hypothetical protein
MFLGYGFLLIWLVYIYADSGLRAFTKALYQFCGRQSLLQKHFISFAEGSRFFKTTLTVLRKAVAFSKVDAFTMS